MAGIKLRNNTWHIRMRVPRRYQAVAGRTEIHRSLGTDSKRQAQALMPSVRAQILAELDAKLQIGAGADSHHVYDAAAALSRARGFSYQPMSELAHAPVAGLVERAEALDEDDTPETAKALLGGIEATWLKLSQLVQEVERISAHENRYKSENQMRLWRHPRNRAARNLMSALGGDIDVRAIGPAEALKHKNWWIERLTQKNLSAESANKDFANLAGLLRRYYDHINVPDAPRPYSRIAISDRHRKKTRKLEIPASWIKENWFAPRALSGLNEQARDILLIAVETGCRQSEIYDLPHDAIILDAPIPHLRIDNHTDGEHRREVKNAPSCRHVPLVGVALAAARRNPDGFQRYRGRSNYSATVNKYLRERGLMPSPDHTVGGTRHAFESRLKAAGVQSDDRGELMGHDVASIRQRELYGDGMPLERKREFIEKIAFPVPEHLA